MDPTVVANNTVQDTPTPNLVGHMNIFQRFLYLIMTGLLSTSIVFLFFLIVGYRTEIHMLIFVLMFIVTAPLLYVLSTNDAQKSNKTIKQEGHLIAISFLIPLIFAYIESVVCTEKLCEIILIFVAFCVVPPFIVGLIYSLVSKRPNKIILFSILMLVGPVLLSIINFL